MANPPSREMWGSEVSQPKLAQGKQLPPQRSNGYQDNRGSQTFTKNPNYSDSRPFNRTATQQTQAGHTQSNSGSSTRSNRPITQSNNFKNYDPKTNKLAQKPEQKVSSVGLKRLAEEAKLHQVEKTKEAITSAVLDTLTEFFCSAGIGAELDDLTARALKRTIKMSIKNWSGSDDDTKFMLHEFEVIADEMQSGNTPPTRHRARAEASRDQKKNKDVLSKIKHIIDRHFSPPSNGTFDTLDLDEIDRLCKTVLVEYPAVKSHENEIAKSIAIRALHYAMTPSAGDPIKFVREVLSEFIDNDENDTGIFKRKDDGNGIDGYSAINEALWGAEGRNIARSRKKFPEGFALKLIDIIGELIDIGVPLITINKRSESAMSSLVKAVRSGYAPPIVPIMLVGFTSADVKRFIAITINRVDGHAHTLCSSGNLFKIMMSRQKKFHRLLAKEIEKHIPQQRSADEILKRILYGIESMIELSVMDDEYTALDEELKKHRDDVVYPVDPKFKSQSYRQKCKHDLQSAVIAEFMEVEKQIAGNVIGEWGTPQEVHTFLTKWLSKPINEDSHELIDDTILATLFQLFQNMHKDDLSTFLPLELRKQIVAHFETKMMYQFKLEGALNKLFGIKNYEISHFVSNTMPSGVTPKQADSSKQSKKQQAKQDKKQGTSSHRPHESQDDSTIEIVPTEQQDSTTYIYGIDDPDAMKRRISRRPKILGKTLEVTLEPDLSETDLFSAIKSVPEVADWLDTLGKFTDQSESEKMAYISDVIMETANTKTNDETIKFIHCCLINVFGKELYSNALGIISACRYLCEMFDDAKMATSNLKQFGVQ